MKEYNVNEYVLIPAAVVVLLSFLFWEHAAEVFLGIAIVALMVALLFVDIDFTVSARRRKKGK